jgi:hypothetical protein
MHLAERIRTDDSSSLQLRARSTKVQDGKDKRERERGEGGEGVSRFMKNPAVAKAESIRFDSW